MEILWNVVLLIAGFVLLIKGADYFVEGASGIADRFGIPQLVIGLTIVAFGTSAPEAAISISAAIKGSSGIAVGNVLGSNILNVLLILGITACILPVAVKNSTIRYEVPFLVVISIVFVALGAYYGELGFGSGCILWAFFIVFLIYLLRMAKKNRGEDSTEEGETKKAPLAIWKLLLMTVLGMAAIIWGSDITVDSATFIAGKLGMSDRLIGLTIVAFGTSLPELITSVTAAIKGKADIAIGNIVGSNIFNILFVLGTTCLIRTVPYSSGFIVDGIVTIATSVFLWFGVRSGHRLVRAEGIAMLVCYAGYFVYLLNS